MRKSRKGSKAKPARSTERYAVRKPRIAYPQPFERLEFEKETYKRDPLDSIEETAESTAFGSGAGGGVSASRGFGFMDLFSSVGGLDGILSGMNKIQKMYAIMKQMGPVFKFIGRIGGFGGLGGLGMRGTGKVTTSALRAGRPRTGAKRR